MGSGVMGVGGACAGRIVFLFGEKVLKLLVLVAECAPTLKGLGKATPTGVPGQDFLFLVGG
jgi:hypothetical protein